MNIYKLAFRSKIPITKLRKLEKLGVLRVKDDGESQFLDGLIFHMRANQTLSVMHLLGLSEGSTLDELEAVKPRYAKRAKNQMLALGNTEDSLAPRDVTAAIEGASRHHPEEARVIADWLKGILPASPVAHAWVAYRMMKPLNPAAREKAASEISLAMVNVRKLPEFAGYWRSEKIGGRSVIKYFALDL